MAEEPKEDQVERESDQSPPAGKKDLGRSKLTGKSASGQTKQGRSGPTPSDRQ